MQQQSWLCFYLLSIHLYNVILVTVYNVNCIFSSQQSTIMILYSLIVLMCRWETTLSLTYQKLGLELVHSDNQVHLWLVASAVVGGSLNKERISSKRFLRAKSYFAVTPCTYLCEVTEVCLSIHNNGQQAHQHDREKHQLALTAAEPLYPSWSALCLYPAIVQRTGSASILDSQRKFPG